ncbi:MAG: hypothetical protein ACKOV8_06525 [Phycisphaerales bacterium]
MCHHTLIATAALSAATAAFAGVIVIDGTAEALYGTAKEVQTIQTQFGNATLGQTGYCNGSELDGAYAVVEDGFLYLTIAGNFESNYNSLELFIDCKAGGQNRLRGDNADVDFNGLNRMGDNGTGNGLTFDTGFEADYYISFRCGVGTIGGLPALVQYMNYADLPTLGLGTGGFAGPGSGPTIPVVAANGIEFTVNNINVAGVTSGPGGASSGAGVVTGAEFKIPLSLIGYVSGDLRVCAFINGGGHGYLSNQVLGGCPVDTQNLGEPRAVNFSTILDEQFIVVVGGGTPPDNCPTDLTDDGFVDGNDLGILLSQWGGPGTADFNQDGFVDGNDLGILLAAWGACPTP